MAIGANKKDPRIEESSFEVSAEAEAEAKVEVEVEVEVEVGCAEIQRIAIGCRPEANESGDYQGSRRQQAQDCQPAILPRRLKEPTQFRLPQRLEALS